MKLFRYLRGHWRLLFGFCPSCNSDAPEIDICSVCNGYRYPQIFPPPKDIKRQWWEYFKERNYK